MGFHGDQVKDSCAVRWLDHDRLAVAELPENIDLSTAGPVREQLLALINHGVQTLVADMTSTASCDHAGVNTLSRVYQHATANGVELRLVAAVSTPAVVRQALDALPGGAGTAVELAARTQHLEETLDEIACRVFEAGLILSGAATASPDGLRDRTDEATRILDDIVKAIYDDMFSARHRTPRAGPGTIAPPAPAEAHAAPAPEEGNSRPQATR